MERLRNYAGKLGYKIIGETSEIASGLNDKRNGLNKILAKTNCDIQDSSKFKAIPQPPGFKNEKQQYKITFPADAVSCNKKKRLLSLGKTGLTISMADIFYEE